MKTYIQLYQKELLDVAVFAESTVSTYTSSINAFCDFIRTTFDIDPVVSQASHLQAWLKALRPGISRSRLRQHQFALKSFFAFLKKMAVIESRGVPFSAIQAMLGHENKAETSLYIHIPDQMKKQGLAQVSISGGETWQ